MGFVQLGDQFHHQQVIGQGRAGLLKGRNKARQNSVPIAANGIFVGIVVLDDVPVSE